MNLSTDVSYLKRKVKDHDDSLQEEHNSILGSIISSNYLVYQKLEEMNNRFNDVDKQLNDVNIKLLDFNIFDIMKKRNESGESSGNNDELFIMIQNIEKKTMKKFEFIDEKNKKFDDEFYKLKNELSTTKNGLEGTNKVVNGIKEEIDIIFARLEDLKNNIKNSIDLSNLNFNEQLKKLSLYIDERINEYLYINILV